MTSLSRLKFTCQEMSQLLSDAMDRTLPFHVRLRMRLHLLTCILCDRYKHQLNLLRKVLRKDGGMLSDDGRVQTPSLSAEAKARIQRTLDSRST